MYGLGMVFSDEVVALAIAEYDVEGEGRRAGYSAEVGDDDSQKQSADYAL